MKYFPILLLLSLLSRPATTQAQSYEPSPENLSNRDWYRDAKFGLFIHWGVYSVLGQHEWVMETEKIDIPTYEKLGKFFNPTAFDAESWVLMAKNAGMKYITITSKHHDGFAMFDSKVSDWDIMDRTVYQKDILKQLADACRKHDMKLFFYYSQLDWHHPDYFPRGSTGKSTGRAENGNWEKYIDYMNAQLRELLTNYGEIGGIWFDGWWDNKSINWELEDTYRMIHELQPGAMIGSNHHQTPFEGEDFQMFEKDLPGQNISGYSGEAMVSQLPLETAETMNGKWGFSLQDKNYKSSRELIQYLVKAAGHNANFLLNVGPMPNGEIQVEFRDTLKIIGQWTKEYGESIYGTRSGPMPPQLWGVSTQKGKEVYIHLLNGSPESLLIPGITKKIEFIQDFDSKQDVKYEMTDFGLLVRLNPDAINPIDHIIKIQLK